MILGPKKIKSATVSIFYPSICGTAVLGVAESDMTKQLHNNSVGLGEWIRSAFPLVVLYAECMDPSEVAISHYLLVSYCSCLTPTSHSSLGGNGGRELGRSRR